MFKTNRQKKNLLGKLKTIAEKLSRAMSHKLYLQECRTKELLPRALNVARHIKSMELKGSEGCFDILKEAGEKLVANQLRKWDIQLGHLTHQKDVLFDKLRIGLNHEEFKHEQTLIAKHANSVMSVEMNKKREKIVRDTEELNIIKGQYTVKKKIQRRFNQVQQEQLNVNNVETDINEPPECRITGKVKNISSRPLSAPEKELLQNPKRSKPRV